MSRKFIIKILPFLLVIICSLSIFFDSHEAYAAVYYVAPDGTDGNAGTSAAPWATFDYAMTALKPGDTLYLKDGIYKKSLKVTVSGAIGKVITLSAVNAGKAIISTSYPTSPLYIYNRSYVEVDGINFRISGVAGSGTANTNNYVNAHGLNIAGSDHITLRGITANGSSGWNSAVISLCGVKNSLIEDCAGSGQGRVVLNMLGCSNLTIRRCWLNWTGPTTGGGDTNSVTQIYDSSYVLMENNIVLNSATSPSDDVGVWAHYENATNNTLIGNIVYHTSTYSAGGLRDTAEYGKHSSRGRFENNVSIVPVAGAYHSLPSDAVGTDHHISKNNTYVGDGDGAGFLVHERPNRPDQVTDAGVKNSSFLDVWGGIYASSSGDNRVTMHKYNNFYNVKVCLVNEKQMSPQNLDPTERCNALKPNYGIAAYGKGAYLMVPAALKGKGEGGADIGATVLYRYQEGTLTTAPLWPWPMEKRIVVEFGVSPTWEANGGIWKSLEGVYSLKKR